MSSKWSPVVGSSRRVKRPSGGTARELASELDALRLAAREGRRGLAELDVAETHFHQCTADGRDRRDVREHLERLLRRQRQDVGDRLALVVDLERLAVVPLAAADVAGDVDVGQEVHLDLDLPVPRARLAPPALDVEGEAPRQITARPGLGCPRHQLADGIEDVGVRRRVRARRPSDGRLVDGDDLVDLEHPLDPRVGPRLLRRIREARGPARDRGCR